MLDKIKSAYLAVRQWCRNSETILLARVQTVSGFVVAAISVADWSPLLGATGMSGKQAFWIGIGLAVKGIVDEAARRYRAKDL